MSGGDLINCIVAQQGFTAPRANTFWFDAAGVGYLLLDSGINRCTFKADGTVDSCTPGRFGGSVDGVMDIRGLDILVGGGGV